MSKALVSNCRGFLFQYICDMEAIYNPEDIVYLITDPERLPRIVTAYKKTKYDITYELASGTTVSWHYDYEISQDIQINKAGFKTPNG